MATTLTSTGIPGLDHTLGGGLPAERLYLIQGDPGVGKTTLGLQFLLEGVRRGEPCLYITFSESHAEVDSAARSHGWPLKGIEVFEFDSVQKALQGEQAGTVFHPSETELSAVVRRVKEVLARVKPKRLVFDSLSELRLLAGDALRYRRQLLDIKSLAATLGCTSLLIDDRTATKDDLQLQSLAHGVISLHRSAAGYGSAKRRMEIVKLRGMSYREGSHDFAILTGGLIIYPRLVASDHHQREGGVISSGVAELDALMGGGLDRGAGTLLLGPAGSGKSTVALKFAESAAALGEKTAIYMFDESASILRTRAHGVGFDLAGMEKAGSVAIHAVDAAETSPGQFAFHVRQAVEKDNARVVIIDSLNGYLNAMPDEKHLMLHLHELLAYAAARGVAVLMIISQHGVLGGAMQQPVDASYLADTVVLFRYYEFEGEIRKALSVFKRRGGAHEPSIRALTLGPPTGVIVGEPLRNFRSILTGNPQYHPPTKAEL